MPSFEAGTAFVSVVPSMRDFQDRVRRGMRSVGDFYVDVHAKVDQNGIDAEFERIVESNRPEVTVGATVDRAKLREAETEVDRMAQRVTDARKREQDAAGQVRVAESRLAEVRKRSASDSSALAAAEERVAKARRSVDAATSNVVRLEREADLARQKMRETESSPPKVGMDTTDAVARLVDLRKRMDMLGDRSVDLNITTGAAKLELNQIRAELDRISLSSADVQVWADTTAAMAELAGVEQYVNRLNGQQANVRVDVNDFGSAARTAASIARVTSVIGLLGPMALTAVGGLLPLAGAFGVMAGAVAPVLLAFGGVGEAMSAYSQQADQAGQTAATSAKQQQAAAQQIEAAQESLGDALSRVRQVREEGARSVAAAESAAESSIAQAVERHQSAERALSSAQRQAESVQRDLISAREDARRQIEDLSASVRNGALQERRAVLQWQSARAELNATLADKTATKQQRQESQLAYDEATAQLDDLRTRNERLATDKAAADRRGINGSAQVVAVTDRIAAAQQRVDDARRESRRTESAIEQARIDGTARVEQAQQQSAQSVASAQESVADAQRALAQAYAQAGEAGAGGVDKVAQAMAKLSPAAQRFVRYLQGLKPQMDELKATAAGGLFPGMQAGIEALLTRFDTIKTVIGQFATAAGDSFKVLGEELAKPYWTTFFTTLGNAAGTVLPAVTQGFLGIGRGVADLVMALLPAAPMIAQIGTAIGGLLSALAPSFGQLAIILGPILVQLLTALQPAFAALGQILVTLAPALGQLAVALAQLITQGLQLALPYIQRFSAAIAENPQRAAALVAALAGIGVALGPMMSVLGVGMRLFTMFSLMRAGADSTGRATGRLGGFFRGLFGPIGLVIGILATLFATNEQFRGAVMQLVGVLGRLIGQVVSALMPVFQALMPVFQQVVAAVMPLISQLAAALLPVLRMIVGLFARLVAAILPPILSLLPALVPIIRLFAQVFMAVWRAISPVVGIFMRMLQAVLPPLINILQAVVVPVVRLLANVFSGVLGFVLRTIIVPVLRLMVNALRVVGDVMGWLWRTIIKPVWDAISGAIKWAWDHVLKPVFDFFAGAAKKVGDAFTGLKKTMKDIFDAIWGILKKPVQIVIDVVWNKSLRLVVNGARWIAGKEALPEIVLAEGGVIPGYRPGKDTEPALLSRGEGVLVPEAVRAIGAESIEAVNRFYTRNRPTVGYATGGVVGGVRRRRPLNTGPMAASGSTDAASATGALDASAAKLGGTVGTVTAATSTLTATTQALAAQGLTPLTTEITTRTTPTLAQLAVQAGTTSANAVRRLTGTMPVLAKQTATTGGVLRGQWQSMSNRVGSTQAYMSARNRALQNSQAQTGVSTRVLANTNATSMSRIATATRSTVANITGRQFPNLRSGLTSVGRAFANTADWVGTSWNRIRRNTRDPVAYAVTKPLNGLIGAWNKLNKEYGLRKYVAPIRLAFARGGQVPGKGTRDTVPAMLTPREVVWDRRAVEAAGGPAAVDAMRIGYRTGLYRQTSNPALHRVSAADRLRAMRHVSLDDLPVQRAYGGVMPNVANAGHAVERVFGGLPGGIGGVGSRPNASDHPLGLALDFMVLQNRKLGDRIAGWLMSNAQRFGLKYLIWKQMINEGSGWSKMEDRGSITANHFDHVHASFLRPGQKGGAFSGAGMYDPQAVVNKAFAGVLKQAKNVGDLFPSIVGHHAGGVSLDAIERVKQFAVEKLNESMFAGGTGAGVDRWRPLVLRALAMLGLPKAWVGVTLRKMWDESKGDPRAFNDWDVNAAANNNSRGLMQVVPTTFESYWDRRTPHDIWNPLSNIVASMRYVMATYGSLPAAYGRPGGYDLGGVARGAGFLAKNTIDPERVLSPQQTRTFDTFVSLLGQGRVVAYADVLDDNRPMWITGNLTVNGLDSHIDGRIDHASDRAGTAFARGNRI